MSGGDGECGRGVVRAAGGSFSSVLGGIRNFHAHIDGGRSYEANFCHPRNVARRRGEQVERCGLSLATIRVIQCGASEGRRERGENLMLRGAGEMSEGGNSEGGEIRETVRGG